MSTRFTWIRHPRVRGLVLMLVGVLWLACAVALGTTAASAGDRQAATVAADRTVGPLFSGALQDGHDCTASALSAGRGLLLTAAHCLTGTSRGLQFVPGYDGTKADATPYGVWSVTRSWIPAGWAADQDPHQDFAILQVDDAVVGGRSESLNEVVGGNALGLVAGTGGSVTVPAYIAGADDAPISCTAALRIDEGYPSFGCGGYTGGTSGAPWLEVGSSGDPAVVGVIGGLHQGGCTDATSYSSRFDTTIYLLLVRAVVGLPSDAVPAAGDDGC